MYLRLWTVWTWFLTTGKTSPGSAQASTQIEEITGIDCYFWNIIDSKE